MTKKTRKLYRSQGILQVLIFLWKHPSRYYIPKELIPKLKLNQNTWATSYRPQLLANNIIKIYKGNEPGRKKFEFHKIEFINYTFDNFIKILQTQSKELIKKFERSKKKCNKLINRCEAEYLGSINESSDLYILETILTNYSNSVEQLLNKTGLLKILELTGKKDLLRFITSEICCDKNEFQKYIELKKNIKNIDRKIKKYKNIKKEYKKDMELKERKDYLIKELSKLKSFKDGIDIIFNSLEASVYVPDNITKFRLLYHYFILTLEKIFEKENITQFNKLLQKIASLWAANSEKSLKNQKLIIELPELPEYAVLTMSDIFLFNKILK